jgi:hypothetical protein
MCSCLMPIRRCVISRKPFAKKKVCFGSEFSLSLIASSHAGIVSPHVLRHTIGGPEQEALRLWCHCGPDSQDGAQIELLCCLERVCPSSNLLDDLTM